jgi:hypothetical protein
MAAFEGDPAVTRALDLLTPPASPDVDGAWQRQRALAAQPAVVRPARFQWLAQSGFRLPAAAIAAVLVVALVVVSPARGIAAQVLTIFRVQDVTPINVASATHPMPDLSQLGDVSPSPKDVRFQPTQVSSLSAASSQVGFAVQTPSQLPSGLANPPSVMAVTSGQTLNFTFRAAKVRAYLDSTGHKDIAVPAKFDGATLTVHIPAAASLAYLPAGTTAADLQAAASSANAGGKPDTSAINRLLSRSGMLIVEAKSPEVDATGVSADELRDFMLSLPGIPEDTKAQLRAIGDWHNTLPVPAPPGSNVHKVSVNGAPGVAGTTGSAPVLLWVKNGLVYAATGSNLDEKGLLAIAGSLG